MPFLSRVQPPQLVTCLCALVLVLALPMGSFAEPAARPARVQPPAAPLNAPPAWTTLTAAQQAALQPLAPIWHEINTSRKRKWIALSANFNRLSATEQATLHVRMGDWARLSTAERNRARLNFVETRDLSAAEKKAQWEAYQALSPAQKQQWATQAGNRPQVGAAPAITGRPTGKLANVPVTRSASAASPVPVPPAANPRAAPPASGASATATTRP
jgi:Protein of unknown function (DUF3106)